ncbi:MAG: hypothetical protein GY838_13745 [bacterium]|nr:hypothetical protein [bacterium]
MIVLVVIGLMAAVSAPPFFSFIQSNRLQTDTDRVVADLQLGRAMAIANSQILQFQATPAGYQLVDPITNDVIRTHNFDHGLALDANFTVNFFPWGMADATVMQISNNSGAQQIDVLPTGMVEVHHP